jgi:lipopolysaccharide transport system ATP-binding protein
MSSDIVIRAQGLGKKYTIGHQSAEAVPTLRDAIMRGAGGLVRSAREMLRGQPIIAGDEMEEFWALKDVNFEVKRGEVLGIIGRNGAGKSTLLKVLSRITEPSEGRVEIKGRVASLLEVGTGFHPELSGRENVYLNGAILGMSRREIRSKFDEIVDFAEIEKYLDTPVKRYSSGMYVRLAFAVAAHLEPEILIIDEVLAVGDAEFQEKCLGKVRDVAGGGRTVLFVSHNEIAVRSLCSQVLYLVNGQIEANGPTNEMLALYASQRKPPTRYDLKQVRKLSATLHLDHVDVEPPTIVSGEPVKIDLTFRAREVGRMNEFALVLNSAQGVRIALVDLREDGDMPYTFAPGDFTISVCIVSAPLTEGAYSFEAYVCAEGITSVVPEIGALTVAAKPQTGSNVPYAPEYLGIVSLQTTSNVMQGAP